MRMLSEAKSFCLLHWRVIDNIMINRRTKRILTEEVKC